jgi:arrestin-related trafficking adapter 9
LDVIDVSSVAVPSPISIRLPDHSKKGKSTGEIQVDVEPRKGGYLKGEEIRLNIKIRHTKPIKNLKGAVVTFFRMSRFDSPKYIPPSNELINFQGANRLHSEKI